MHDNIHKNKEQILGVSVIVSIKKIPLKKNRFKKNIYKKCFL